MCLAGQGLSKDPPGGVGGLFYCIISNIQSLDLPFFGVVSLIIDVDEIRTSMCAWYEHVCSKLG